MRVLALAAVLGHAPLALSAQSPDTGATVYRIQPGDVLRIRLFTGGSEISFVGGNTGPSVIDYPVEESGLVFLPRIGPVTAAGKTTEELRRELREAYSKVYPESIVTVTPIFFVPVLGAVRNPAAIEGTEKLTVFDAIARAGGFTEDANRRKIEVYRRGQIVIIDATGTEGGQTLGQHVLQSGDRIVVPTRRRWTWQATFAAVQVVAVLVTIYSVFRD
jgi:polysaccharide export outer membrane protein